MNKKGISALIETVLLILVVLAAAGIIFGAVIPMLRAPVEKATLCEGAIDVTSATASSVTITKAKDVVIDSITVNAFDKDGKAGTFTITTTSTPVAVPAAVGAVATVNTPAITGGGSPVKVSIVAAVNTTANKKIACSPVEAPIA